MRIFLTTGAVVAALLLTASPAAADTWHWGPVKSADGKGKVTNGKIVGTSAGLKITGRLYDATAGGSCSWVRFRYLTDQGKTVRKSYKNCKAGWRTVALRTGHVLSVEAQVCRGTSKGVGGHCSAYEGVWAQGG
ncbi:hypothetical protein [Herbidospora cretacea]|uniref:hypothetical protein n=1 Tax=Herbidospora cretacea TaxID=28444 RepID=UPI0007738F60|nr:hypothetical protein [Herbidospora cretacea]